MALSSNRFDPREREREREREELIKEREIV